MASTGAAFAGKLICVVAGEHIALDASRVLEVIEPSAQTRVPNAPAALQGLAKYRGTVLPVVSLGRLLGREAAVTNARSRIVVYDHGEPTGLAVDAVLGLGGASKSEARSVDLESALDNAFRFEARRRETVAGTVAGPDRSEASQPLREILTFEIGGQFFGLPLAAVDEIVDFPRDMAYEEQVSPVIGALPHRGGVLPVAAASVMLGLPWSIAGKIVVVSIAGKRLGLVVDNVMKVERLAEVAIEPIPTLLKKARGTAGIDEIARIDGGRRILSILSQDKLFENDGIADAIEAGAAGTVQKDGDAVTIDQKQFILFNLGEERYGIPLLAVDEVIRVPDAVTRVPNAPAFLRGLINLRGRPIPLIDQRIRFRTESLARGSARAIVLTIGELQAAVIVDAVSEVLTAPVRRLAAIEDFVADGDSVFDEVVEMRDSEDVLLVINPERLLSGAERDMLGGIVKTAGKS